VEKGLLKVNNFRSSQNKVAYLYLLTPHGIEEKAKVTLRFMQRKVQEYEALKHEIELLQREAGSLAGGMNPSPITQNAALQKRSEG